MTSTYHSSTHGHIPLSTHAKGLMQNLRDAVVAGIGCGNYDHKRQAIAHARGELAQYISKLEAAVPKSGAPEPEPVKTAHDALVSAMAGLQNRVTNGVATHNREKILALLLKGGNRRLSELRFNELIILSCDLEALESGEIAFQRAKAEAENVNGVYITDAHARALFEAGRASKI